MKDNRIFNALTDIDDDLIKGAEHPQLKKEAEKQGAAILRPGRKALIALIAAALVIATVFAALAIGGAFSKKPDGTPAAPLPSGDGSTHFSSGDPVSAEPSAPDSHSTETAYVGTQTAETPATPTPSETPVTPTQEETSITPAPTATVEPTAPTDASTTDGDATTTPEIDPVRSAVFTYGALSEDELKREENDRISYVGLLVCVFDDKTYLCLGEGSALYDPEAQTFVGGERRSSHLLWRVLERLYEGAAFVDGKIYFAYGSSNTFLVSGNKTNGVARYDPLTGKIEKLIACDGAVKSIFVRDDVLYFTQAIISVEDQSDQIRVYKVDMKTPEITCVCTLDGSSIDKNSAAILDVSSDALTLLVSINRKEHLCTVPLDGSDPVYTEIERENENMYCFLDGGKLYGYIVEHGKDIYDCPECIFEILSNGERRVVCSFAEEDRAHLQLRGTYCDAFSILDGKLVALKDHALILRDLETGEETTLLTDVCMGNEMNRRKSFSTAVSDGILYFHDLCSDTLYVVKDGAVLSQTVLQDIPVTPARAFYS